MSSVIFVTGWSEWKYRKGTLFLSSWHDLTTVSSVTRKKTGGISENSKTIPCKHGICGQS